MTKRAAALTLLAIALAAPPAHAQPAERSIALSIVNRSVSGPDVLPGRGAGAVKVLQGDTIAIRFSSDEAATLHLHGYNVQTKIAAGGIADMRFRARATGRFAIETHGIGKESRLHKTLIYIEVHPR